MEAYLRVIKTRHGAVFAHPGTMEAQPGAVLTLEL
jgi:hypothetical protein